MTAKARAHMRLTKATREVLDILAAAEADDPMWGFRLCELADLGSGTVYPILERLEDLGWVRGFPEEPKPVGRPRRQHYEMTDLGRGQYAAALQARASARRRWLPASGRPQGGGERAH